MRSGTRGKDGNGNSAELDLSDRLDRTTTAHDVTRVLRRRILEGRYPVDQFIRQETIAQELGVSRIPVREALRRLGIGDLDEAHRCREFLRESSQEAYDVLVLGERAGEE